MYFDYTDASNELINAFEEGVKFALIEGNKKLEAENEKLNKKLIDAEYAMKKSLLHRDFDDIRRFYKEYKNELEGEK